MSKNIPHPTNSSPILESQLHPQGYLTEYCCNRMRHERIRCNLTQQELADLLQVSPDTIQRNETGKTKYLRWDYVCDAARVLGIPLQSLLPSQGDAIDDRLRQLESKLAAIRDIINSN